MEKGQEEILDKPVVAAVTVHHEFISNQDAIAGIPPPPQAVNYFALLYGIMPNKEIPINEVCELFGVYDARWLDVVRTNGVDYVLPTNVKISVIYEENGVYVLNYFVRTDSGISDIRSEKWTKNKMLNSNYCLLNFSKVH